MKKIIYTVWKYTPNFGKTIATKIITHFYLKGVTIGEKCTFPIFGIISGSIKIGIGSFVGKNCSFFCLEKGSISIGNYCSIAQDSFFITYNHAVEYLSMNYIPGLDLPERRTEKSISIGHNVWIGTRATILPGVTIGNGAIVGAGSVVTKDVAAYSIVGGIPAKHIKYRFDTATIDAIEKIDWYDWSIEKIQKNKDIFCIKLSSETLQELQIQ